MGRIWHKLSRHAIALAMALFFVCEGAGTLLQGWGGMEENCGMACCRRMKSCCCRKGGRHETDPSRPQWGAGAACEKSCRLKAALPQMRPGVAAAESLTILPQAGVEIMKAPAAAEGFAVEAGLSLPGRSPPCFC